jgi:predicted aspartyl protease
MAVAYFPSTEQADILDVVFSSSQGGEAALRLLVDSGFTGESCFVLNATAHELEQLPADDSRVSGALQGIQKRSIVAGRIPALSLHFKALAILADTANLALPPGIQGIVGLQFLRQFRRWGAEKTSDGTWRFFLEIDSNSNGG